MREVDRWGPFAPGITPVERVARLRALQAIVRILLGQRGRDLALLLREAEGDAALLEPAVLMIDRLASLDRRHVLASYGSFVRLA